MNPTPQFNPPPVAAPLVVTVNELSGGKLSTLMYTLSAYRASRGDRTSGTRNSAPSPRSNG